MNKNSHLPGLLRVTAAMVALAAGLLLSVALVSAAQATVSERSPQALEPARDAAPVALPTTASKAPSSPNGPIDPAGIERLVNATNGAVTVSLHRATGAARFVRVAADQPGALSALLGPTASAEEQAAAFFAEYGSIFGIADAGVQLSLIETKTDGLGTTRLLYRQVHNGVSVFAGLVLVHFNKANQLTAINGTFIPDVALDANPALSAESAGEAALATVAAQKPDKANLAVRQNKLYVYRKDLAKGVSGVNHLVYEVEVGNGVDVREFVYINAHSGKIVDQVSGIHEALDRRVYNGGYDPGLIVWEEGDTYPFVGADITETTDINNLIDGTGESYNLFFDAFGRDSYDGAGATMETVNNDPGILCPNANWNGTSTNYCTGVTGDDTVAHEWGHAYTEYTHGLIYAWQPGALNEAYSDIWGEVVDLINGRGLDSPGGTRTVGACSVYTPFPPKVTVISPASIAGDYAAGSASFGLAVPASGITGTVVLANDGVGQAEPPADSTQASVSDGCETFVNAAEIAGNIAMIDRGTCGFTTKVINAEAAGAIAVIIANHEAGGDGVISMGGTPTTTISISSVSVGDSDGDAYRAELSNTVTAVIGLDSGTLPPEDSYRWLSGEDDPAFGGAIRDMWSPGCYGDPAEVIEDNYFCATSDGGGVHTNSGVPNHAFALLVDGGTYNGVTVTGIGLTKTAHIYFRAQDEYQVPASDFADHADALESSCTDLIGVNLNDLTTGLPSGAIISAADCTEVADAMDAVEMREDPTAQCGFEALLEQNAPAFCPAGNGPTSLVFSDTLEIDPSATWTVSHTDVYSTTTFDWLWDSTLPGGRSGSAFYGPDPANDGGDCSLGIGDVSRVMYLTSPLITLPVTTTVPRAAFDHYVATEAGYDGGNLKVSVNGGAWTLVDAADYTFNPYNATLLATNPLAGEEGFSGTDGGQVTGSWGQSQVNLSNYASPGDTIQLRFELGTDGCGGVDGWYVDNAAVYYCDSQIVDPTISVGPSELSSTQGPGTSAMQTLYITNTGDTALTWSIFEIAALAETAEDEVSAPQAPTFEELTAVRRPGSAPASRTSEATGSPNAPQVDVVADGSFEAGTPNPSWNEFSLLFGTPLCTVALCGGPAPHTGIWHAWFGGAGGPAEEGYVDQDVTILSGTATLSFWLQIGVVSPATGVLTASVDGTAVFTATEADAATYSTYTQVTVDVSAFADDGVHNLRLGQSNPDNGANNINFFVDDVVLDAVTAGGCTANDIPWLSVSPSFGTTPFGNTSEVEVTFDSTGLASGTYTGTVCIDSNDPVNPTINVPVTLTVTPPSVALAASSYSVAENAGSTTVTATLSASYPTTVTVSYATSDGTALAGSDYTTVTGTLTFAPGATSATFTVPILDDTADEPDVLFTVTLSSPSGATLGSPASATVTILDDEVVYLLHLPIISRGTVN